MRFLRALIKTALDPTNTPAAVRALRPLAERSEGLLRHPYRHQSLGAHLLTREPSVREETRVAWKMPPIPFTLDELPRTPAARRWFLVHDVTHGLTGYPTTPAGGVLVGAFMLGCYPGDTLALATLSTQLVLPIYGWDRATWHALKVAWEWGKTVQPERLHATPYESLQDLTLRQLRYSIGIFQ